MLALRCQDAIFPSRFQTYGRMYFSENSPSLSSLNFLNLATQLFPRMTTVPHSFKELKFRAGRVQSNLITAYRIFSIVKLACVSYHKNLYCLSHLVTPYHIFSIVKVFCVSYHILSQKFVLLVTSFL